MKSILLIILILTLANLANGQISDYDSTNSTMNFWLPEIKVIPEYKFKNHREEQKYIELERDIRKIYPLVIKIKAEYDKTQKELTLYKGKERTAYLKWYEAYVKQHYYNDLSGLTISQGRLLLKLIDRELGETPYRLLKEYRNGFRALFWQGTAILFFSNLNAEYTREENPIIEHIFKRIENESNGLIDPKIYRPF